MCSYKLLQPDTPVGWFLGYIHLKSRRGTFTTQSHIFGMSSDDSLRDWDAGEDEHEFPVVGRRTGIRLDAAQDVDKRELVALQEIVKVGEADGGVWWTRCQFIVGAIHEGSNYLISLDAELQLCFKVLSLGHCEGYHCKNCSGGRCSTYNESLNPLTWDYGDIHLQMLAVGLFEIHLNNLSELASSAGWA